MPPSRPRATSLPVVASSGAAPPRAAASRAVPGAGEEAASKRILYCHCAYSRVVKDHVKDPVLQGLAEADVAFDAVPDLCELAARQDPSLVRLAAEGEVAIVACYPRAVRWLFHAAEAPLPEDGVEIHNMRAEDPEVILERVLGEPDAQDSAEAAPPPPSAGAKTRVAL